MKLAQRLTIARKNARLTQQRLAERAGIAVSTVQAIEQGRPNGINPGINTVIALAGVLGMSVDELLSGAVVEAPVVEKVIEPPAAVAEESVDGRDWIQARPGERDREAKADDLEGQF